MGADPVVQRLLFCAPKSSTATTARAVVHLSENVSTSGGASALMKVSDQMGNACTWSADPSSPQSQLFFDCPAAAWGTQSIHFELVSGAPVGVMNHAPASNAQVVSRAGLVTDFSFAGLPDATSNCKQVRPESK